MRARFAITSVYAGHCRATSVIFQVVAAVADGGAEQSSAPIATNNQIRLDPRRAKRMAPIMGSDYGTNSPACLVLSQEAGKAGMATRRCRAVG